MARVALVTWAEKSDRTERENALVARALSDVGVEAEPVVWTRPIAWSRFDLALVRTPWDYTEDLARFRAWVASVPVPLWNPRGVLLWNTDKRYLLELGAGGVRVPPTAHVPRGGRLDVRALGWPEVVVKAAVDAGARRAWRGAGLDAAQEFLDALVVDRDALVQPFLPAVVERGELSMVFFDGAFSHAVRKRPAPGDWRVQPQWGGSHAEAAPTEAELDLASRALAATPGPTLYARVDVADGPGGPCLMELEVVEPYLFLDDASAARFASAIRRRL